nr:cyanobactin biosynthesis PatC/TenC/TruC family protein [Arthrospira sp. PLM2.Bin9]
MTKQTETLWQIGNPGKRGQEFVQAGGWQAEFTYTVGADADPIHAPKLPPLLLVPSLANKPKRGRKELFATDKLNICFTLTQNYGPKDLTLFYDFFGSETDTLLLNGQPLAELVGVGEGKLKQNQILLPALEAGKHTLTLTTAGGVGDGAHWIDYFKLEGATVPQPIPQPTQTMAKKKSESQPQETAPQKSYLPTTMTGLHDYSYWWEYAREHAKRAKPNSKTFRRGRIWA